MYAGHTMKNEIKLKRDLIAGVWVAVFAGPYSETVASLFGSNVIPTPYRVATSASKVLVETIARNPGFQVSVQ